MGYAQGIHSGNSKAMGFRHYMILGINVLSKEILQLITYEDSSVMDHTCGM
jgi:hypothetical protein